jgi:dihydroneopterin aldolase
MKNHIQVNGIRIYAHHGCLPEETKIGGNYIVDVELETDFLKAAKNDSLTDTIDYVIINKIVSEEMEIPSKLIEHVGYRIYQRIKRESNTIDKLTIKITKICPPINGDVANVSIIISE